MSEVELIEALSEEEVAEIEAKISHLPDRQSAAIDALLIVQKRRRWISDESLRAIARLLAMSAEALDGIATFYNLIYRQPVGRHVVMICDSVSCYIMGSDGLAKEVQKKLNINFGGTTPDDRFTLLPIVCLGACDRAPTMMIGQDLIGDVSVEKLDDVFEMYV